MSAPAKSTSGVGRSSRQSRGRTLGCDPSGRDQPAYYKAIVGSQTFVREGSSSGGWYGPDRSHATERGGNQHYGELKVVG
jgi:hypothetical protein